MKYVHTRWPEAEAIDEAIHQSACGRNVLLVVPTNDAIGRAHKATVEHEAALPILAITHVARIFIRCAKRPSSLKSVSPEVLILVGSIDRHVKLLCLERLRSTLHPQAFHFRGY